MSHMHYFAGALVCGVREWAASIYRAAEKEGVPGNQASGIQNSRNLLWMVHGKLLHPRAGLYTIGPIQSSAGDEAHLITASTVMLMASTWGSLTGGLLGRSLSPFESP
jgi:hypothetical protein